MEGVGATGVGVAAPPQAAANADKRSGRSVVVRVLILVFPVRLRVVADPGRRPCFVSGRKTKFPHLREDLRMDPGNEISDRCHP